MEYADPDKKYKSTQRTSPQTLSNTNPSRGLAGNFFYGTWYHKGITRSLVHKKDVGKYLAQTLNIGYLVILNRVIPAYACDQKDKILHFS